MKSIVVTGVSTGIGWGVTKVLIRNGFRVYGSVRKAQDAERLQKEFGAAFTPLIFDITDQQKVIAEAERLRGILDGESLFGLVNNAGMAVAAPLLNLPIADFRRQIEVNLTGQLIVTQAFASLLGAKRDFKGKPGRIVNISSVAGTRAFPFLGAYAASKHALEGMSEALRRELMLYGIDVIVIGPGAVATPIWDKAEQADYSFLQNSDYYQAATGFRDFMVADGKKGLPPEKLGEVVHKALTKDRPKLRYAVVPGNPIANFIQRLLPKRMLDRIIAKNLGFAR